MPVPDGFAAPLLTGQILAGWPSQCEICRRWGNARLCADCLGRYARPQPRCAGCALRLGLEAAACGECLAEPPPFRHTVCAVDYDFPWAQLLQGFKFEGQLELAGPLAELMEQALRRARRPGPVLVLPVPLAHERLRERGYNQAWELARRVARRLGLAARADLLQRPLHTAAQAELSRAERQRNLRAAFWLPPAAAAAVAGLEVALVDDVMTTGATAREAAAALRRAGAAAVDIWVLARTPAPGG